MNFYNTTNEKGQTLIDFTAKAKTGDEMVLEYFLGHPDECITWSELSIKFPDMNEVSLKRSLSNLKNAGKLVKTDEKGVSKYGRPAKKYKLAA